ncbi:regulator of chromosome condensation 1/beta-lactamase-inhibitor protein II [Hypomontagnella monticulosa]|nr:regulator of chromosome condensation 1/beta-lactamase-inhibitor protein II [Hypomontagnella monticulosa]
MPPKKGKKAVQAPSASKTTKAGPSKTYESSSEDRSDAESSGNALRKRSRPAVSEPVPEPRNATRKRKEREADEDQDEEQNGVTKKPRREPEEPKSAAPKAKSKKAPPKKAEPKKAEPKKATPQQAVPKKPERKRNDFRKTEPPRGEGGVAEPKEATPQQAVPKKPARKRNDFSKTEPPRREGGVAVPPNPAPKKPEPQKENQPKTRKRPTTYPIPDVPPNELREIIQRKPGDAPRPRVTNRGIINVVPTKQFDIFVFGEGTSGELGLGSMKYDGGKKPVDVKRPRLNHNLKGIVAIACGGMHCIALTHDQKVLTWGVNDDKALGRDTHWEGGVRDVDDGASDDDDNDTGMNPLESTPGEVDLSAIGESKVYQVHATDSASFIVTDDGWVYGWGTFRGADGILGFSEGVKIQPTPVRISGPSKVYTLACGTNHVLSLDLLGKVRAWGSGGQYQLGRKILSRNMQQGLFPHLCGKFSSNHAVAIGAGSYHSFYVDNFGKVFSWGLNNYGQTGVPTNMGKDDAMVVNAQHVKSLDGLNITQIAGGEHHTLALAKDGRVFTWGRVDGHQVGHPPSVLTEENTISDPNNPNNKSPRILARPTALEGIEGTFIAVGTDTSFVVDKNGRVYSWGFSTNYQTGQGIQNDVEVPTLIDNTAIRDRKVVWAGAGGQFSVLAAEPEADAQISANSRTKAPAARAGLGIPTPVPTPGEARAKANIPVAPHVESEGPRAAMAQVADPVDTETEDQVMADAAASDEALVTTMAVDSEVLPNGD